MNILSLSKNTFIYGIGNIFLRASAFLLIPLYTHSLSVSDYGLFSNLLLTIQIMIITMNFGMRSAFFRYTKEYEAKLLMGELLGSSLLVNIMAGIFSSAALILFLKQFFRTILHTENIDEYLILTCLAALVQTLCLQVMCYYRATDQAAKFAYISVFAALLLFVINIILLKFFFMDVRGALLAAIITHCVTLLFILIDVILKKTGIRITFSTIKKLLNFGSPLIFSMMGTLIMGSSSIYFLSYYKGLEVAAFYALGYKLAAVVGIVLTLPFQLAFQPFVFANIEDPNLKRTLSTLLTYFLMSVVIISFSILLTSRILLPFIAPPEYASAYLILLLLLPSEAYKGLLVFGETLLGISKKTHIIGTTVGICGCLSLILNFLLIPLMSWYGALIASNISCISAALIVLIFGIKSYPINIEWLRAGFTVCIFTFFLTIMFFLQTTSNFIFFLGALISACLVVTSANFIHLFDDKERATIRKSLLLLGLRKSS